MMSPFDTNEGSPRRETRLLMVIDGNESSVPRMRPTRLGVMLHEKSEFRPLLGIRASRDGGLIVWPGGCVPVETWSYGRGSAPGGRYIGLSAGDVEQPPLTTDVAPKLHYHQSGWVSVDATGRLPKRWLRCLPMDRMRGAQCFGFSAVKPAMAPTKEFRRGDAVVVAHGQWPARVGVAGYLYARDQLPMSYLVGPDDRPGGILQNEVAEIVFDLQGHGLDVALVLRFSTSGVDDEVGEPHVVLFGFDYRAAVMDTLVDCVGMWSAHTVVKAIPVTPPHQLPFHRVALGAGRTGIVRAHRSPGAGPTGIEPFA